MLLPARRWHGFLYVESFSYPQPFGGFFFRLVLLITVNVFCYYYDDNEKVLRLLIMTPTLLGRIGHDSFLL